MQLAHRLQFVAMFCFVRKSDFLRLETRNSPSVFCLPKRTGPQNLLLCGLQCLSHRIFEILCWGAHGDSASAPVGDAKPSSASRQSSGGAYPFCASSENPSTICELAQPFLDLKTEPTFLRSIETGLSQTRMRFLSFVRRNQKDQFEMCAFKVLTHLQES